MDEYIYRKKNKNYHRWRRQKMFILWKITNKIWWWDTKQKEKRVRVRGGRGARKVINRNQIGFYLIFGFILSRFLTLDLSAIQYLFINAIAETLPIIIICDRMFIKFGRIAFVRLGKVFRWDSMCPNRIVLQCVRTVSPHNRIYWSLCNTLAFILYSNRHTWQWQMQTYYYLLFLSCGTAKKNSWNYLHD